MRFQSNIFWTCPSRACATTSWPAIKVALATTSWPAVKVALATTGWPAMPDAADSPPRKGSIADMMRKGASDVMSSFSSGAKRSRVAASGDFDDVSEAGAATRERRHDDLFRAARRRRLPVRSHAAVAAVHRLAAFAAVLAHAVARVPAAVEAEVQRLLEPAAAPECCDARHRRMRRIAVDVAASEDGAVAFGLAVAFALGTASRWPLRGGRRAVGGASSHN